MHSGGCLVTAVLVVGMVMVMVMVMGTELREVACVRDYFIWGGVFVCFPPPPILVLFVKCFFCFVQYVGCRM